MPYIMNNYLNGKGADMSSFTDGMPLSENSLLNDTLELSINMSAGKKHLFRIANVGALYSHFISLGKQNLSCPVR
jgi:hypothetical protein